MHRLGTLFSIIILIIGSTKAQNGPISQIEGILEVYSNIDSTSIYIGKNVGRNVDSTWYYDEVGALIPYFNNTFIGSNAGEKNTTGYENTFVGAQAGLYNSSGLANAFYGNRTGLDNISGRGNSFFGNYAGRRNINGSWNAFYGISSGSSNRDGSNNCYFGSCSGGGNSAFGNVAIGTRAGKGIGDGEKNIVIGFESGPSGGSSISNKLFIDVEGSNTPLIYGDFERDSIVIHGDLNVVGAIIGDISGELTGNVTGNVLGDITGDLVGNVIGDVTGSVSGPITADSILALVNLGVNNNKGITLAENENPVFGIIYDGEGEGNENRFHVKRLLGGTQTIATFTGQGSVGIGVETPHALLHVQGAVDAFLGGGGHIMTGSENGINLVMDNNEIIARNAGQASKLFLNKESGEVIIGGRLRVQDDSSTNEAGQIRYNTVTNDFEGCDGTTWYSLTNNKSSFASSARSSTISNKSRLSTDYQKLILDNKKSTIENSKLMKLLTETIISLRLENTNLKDRLDKLENH